jgi:hypothetical protein
MLLFHDAHRTDGLGNQLRLGRLLEVEVGHVELSGFLQAVPIFDDNAPVLLRADETVSPEFPACG